MFKIISRIIFVILFIILCVICGVIGAIIGAVIGVVFLPVCLADGRMYEPSTIVGNIINGSGTDHI